MGWEAPSPAGRTEGLSKGAWRRTLLDIRVELPAYMGKALRIHLALCLFRYLTNAWRGISIMSLELRRWRRHAGVSLQRTGDDVMW